MTTGGTAPAATAAILAGATTRDGTPRGEEGEETSTTVLSVVVVVDARSRRFEEPFLL